MAVYNSNFMQTGMPGIAPHSAGELHIAEGTVSFPATLANNDIAKVCYLPANCIPVDLVVHTEELDSNAVDTMTFSVGLLNPAGDDIVADTEMLTGGTAEAVQTIRGAGVGFNKIERDVINDRVVAVKITADAATAAAGGMRVCLTFRASEWGN